MNTIKSNSIGIGLRLPHIRQIIELRPDVDWLEIHSCNFVDSKTNLALLDKVAEHYALSFHGVSLNLGGIEPLNKPYLYSLKAMCDEFQPALISDHACFTTLGNRNYHDLLPIPFSLEAVRHMATRITQIQDALQRQILVENVSRYYNYPDQDLSEAGFLSALVENSGCGLLLDINNAYVNQKNHGQSAFDFCRALPSDSIKEVHLGGHHVDDELYIDCHSKPIADNVWGLYQRFTHYHKDRNNKKLPATLIEWDNQLPPLETLLRERNRAKKIIGTPHSTTTELELSVTSKAS